MDIAKRAADQPWWKSAVIYQIYPLSFMDSNGDGVGDIPGIISKLDYLEDLGIDAIWLSPVYRSPQYDNGYDISDYRDIDPLFGTLADMDRLIAEAKKRGIRIIMDLVLNHSSDEHAWFLEARKSRDNPYHDYYIWRDGEPGSPPDNVTASFGGSEWEWVPELGQYYFHQFSWKQPDLNWDNPKLRQELYDMIRWWTARGIGGFRLDVVDHLGKDPDRKIKVNGPRLHEYIREMSREAFQSGDLVTVGEAWSATPENARLYSAPDGSELSMVFQFEHMLLDKTPDGEKWDLAPLRFPRLMEVLGRWQAALSDSGWNSLFWENHDLPRIVSRWGDDGELRGRCARMLAILLFGLQGTPYIYQGQELGMTNTDFALEDFRDIESLDMIRQRRGRGVSDTEILRALRARSRDNARTPMQWSAAENAGFTEGTPWLGVNPNYRTVNAEAQLADPGSVHACYKELIRLRRQFPVFVDGSFSPLLEGDEQRFAYTRTNAAEELLVTGNFGGTETEDPGLCSGDGWELLISSCPDAPIPGKLRPYEARIYRRVFAAEN